MDELNRILKRKPKEQTLSSNFYDLLRFFHALCYDDEICSLKYEEEKKDGKTFCWFMDPPPLEEIEQDFFKYFDQVVKDRCYEVMHALESFMWNLTADKRIGSYTEELQNSSCLQVWRDLKEFKELNRNNSIKDLVQALFDSYSDPEVLDGDNKIKRDHFLDFLAEVDGNYY